MAGAEFKRMLCDGAAMRALGLGKVHRGDPIVASLGLDNSHSSYGPYIFHTLQAWLNTKRAHNPPRSRLCSVNRQPILPTIISTIANPNPAPLALSRL